MRIHENVVSKTLNDEEIVLHLKTGTYFGLNPTAAAVFKRLKSETNRENLVSAVCAEFEVDRTTAERDVDELLKSLGEHGLLCGES